MYESDKVPIVINNIDTNGGTLSNPSFIKQCPNNEAPSLIDSHSSNPTISQQVQGTPIGKGQDDQPCPEISDLEGDLESLETLRAKYTSNPSIGYLNINSLRGSKFAQLNEMCKISKMDIFCIDETKLTSEIPTSRFHIDGYQYPPIRRDRANVTSDNSFGGGKLVYIKDGLICKRVENFETPTAETICIELLLKSQKWFIMFGYRPESINRDIFFEEINITLSKAINKYKNILFIGDLNIDLKIPNHDKKHFLEDICDAFDLTNMVKGKTCFMSTEGSSIDVMLTNKPRSFFKTYTIETGLSDHHKLILTFLRSHYSNKLKAKKIIYRDIKNINYEQFEYDIATLPMDEIHRFPDPYTGFSTLFKSIVDRHAPIKTNIIRGNNKPFMNKELGKALKTKSRIKNKWNKWRSRENFLEWQKIKKKCNYLTWKAEKDHFEKILSNGVITNKELWDKVKPALSHKYDKFQSDIILKEGECLISDDVKVSEILNNQYINIVEISTGSAPSSQGSIDLASKEAMKSYIDKVVTHYEKHPSIITIKEHIQNLNIPPFKIPLAQTEDIDILLKQIDVKKAAGPDLILPVLVKHVSHLINEPIKNIINDMLSTSMFPDNGKIAHVTPVFKIDKKDRQNKANYRPISITGTFSKILERYIQNQINSHVESFLSIFISAYRKKYSSNHVLIRLIENWKLHLDNKKYVGAVLMDLSKAFDCVPHDLLIAKMHAYGFDYDTLNLFLSYLKNRKQGVKVNNSISHLMTMISGVPQGSILGPILFNLFINDLVFFMKHSDLINYADDNTISAWANSIQELILTLESESETAIKWFRDNEMIVNPDKFQAIIINKHGKSERNNYTLKFNEYEIESKNSVTLLGIDIDNKLSFHDHIHTLTRKAAGQLNYLISKKKFLNIEAKKVLIESFIISNFNYCPLVWLFCNYKSTSKQEAIQKRALRFLYDDYESSYEHLLTLANKPTIEVRKLRFLAIEIFKTINSLNPSFMKEIFTLNTIRDASRNLLMVKAQSTKQYGTDTLRSLGPKIWNSLLPEIRSSENLNIFKSLIKTWSGPSCGCSNCRSF